MKSSDLFLFTGNCLAMDNDPALKEEVIRMIASGTIPWEDFVWTGSSHYVLPALFSAFRRNGMLPLLPEELANHMEHIHSLNFARNRQILDQCREMGDFLHHQGVEPLFLKGAGFLLTGLYHDLGDRVMEDIDILIPEKDLQKATEYLSVLGYLPAENSPGEEIYEDHHHLPPLVSREKTAPVEIHRLPVHREFEHMVPVQGIYIDRVQSAEKNCRVASVGDMQLIIFFHETRSSRGYLSSIPSLKNMYDFYLLAKLCPPDPRSLPPGRTRKRFRRFMYITGKYFADPEWLACPETPDLVRYWKREMFLLNNPVWDFFWHNYIYAPAIFTKLLVMSALSGRSRNLVMGKIRKFKRRLNPGVIIRGSEGERERFLTKR